MGKGRSLGGWMNQQPHTDRFDCLVAEGGCCGSSLALSGTSGTAWRCSVPGSGAAVLTSYHWHGHSQAQTTTSTAIRPISVCCWLCIWGLPGLQSSLDRGEGARAELSHATCPRQGLQQAEANPVLPSPKAIKNEAHSAAHLSSDQITALETAAPPSSTAGAGNATWAAQHPQPPTPTLQAVSPTNANCQVGWQEKAPSSALPPCGEMLWQRQQRGEAAAPRRVPLSAAWIAQGCSGRGTGGLAVRGSDLIVFAKTLTKDTDWEQTKHSRGRSLGKCRDKLGLNTRHRALARETSLAKQAGSLELLQSRGVLTALPAGRVGVLGERGAAAPTH